MLLNRCLPDHYSLLRMVLELNKLQSFMCHFCTMWSCCVHGIIVSSALIKIVSCAGWFARDPNVLRRVGHVLLQLPFGIQRNPQQIIIADDCFELPKFPVDRIVQVVIKSTEKLYGSKFFCFIPLAEILLLKIHLASLYSIFTFSASIYV